MLEQCLFTALQGHFWYCGVVMSGEDAPRPVLENLIVLASNKNIQITTINCP